MKLGFITILVVALNCVFISTAVKASEKTNDISESLMDYAKLQEKYLSYLGKKRLVAKFEKKLADLPEDIQYTLLKTFKIGNEEVGHILSDKDKQQFVGRIMKFYEEVHKGAGQSGNILALLLNKIPALKGKEFEEMTSLIAQQADHYEYKMSDEDAVEIARLQASIDQSEKRSAEYQAQSAEYQAQSAEYQAQSAQSEKRSAEYQAQSAQSEKRSAEYQAQSAEYQAQSAQSEKNTEKLNKIADAFGIKSQTLAKKSKGVGVKSP